MKETMSKSKLFTAKNIALCAMFTALMIIGAYLQIPIGPFAPITLQTLFVALAGFLLGSRLGAISTIAYILIGLAGLPVFAGFSGGIGHVLKPTFGYLLGMALGAFLAGRIVESSKNKRRMTYLWASLAFIGSVYVIGLPYIYCILNFYMGKTVAVGDAVVSYFLIFLPNDIIKCVIAALIAVKLKPILMKKAA